VGAGNVRRQVTINTVLADATPAPAGIAHADAAPAGDVRRVNQVRDKASDRPHDPGTG
jgi:hypothetical protein